MTGGTSRRSHDASHRGCHSRCRAFDGRYTLTVLGGAGAGAPRVRLDYSARFELAEPLPPIIGPLFGTAAVRQTLREQFGATVTEIERRSSARQGAR